MSIKSIERNNQMKQQTFGVEVEGNNITREHAAEIAAKYFKTGRYEYTGYTNGYRTWSAWDEQGREWKFQRDSSICGPDDEKCELVTPVLKYEDMEFFLELLRQLRHAGMKSSPSRGCGVHIHVGLKGLDGRDHNAKTLRNLVNIMASHEEQIGRAIRIDSRRTHIYCQVVNKSFLTEMNKRKPETMSELADIWYTTQHETYDRDSHYNSSRYHMINLHTSFQRGYTVEFRMFQFEDEHDGKLGGIHAGQMKSFIQLCLAMSNLAKEVKTASPKPQQTDNEKFAMRCWLRQRLGMIGDEFKTAREYLMKNLEGNMAHRHAA